MSQRGRPNSPAGRQVSQREIGELAGVSQATVSLVLAGRKVNSEETRRRVLDAAKQLKYRPNLLVHGMQTGKSKAIGVMAPPYDYYWSRVLFGIHDTLALHDYVPITVWPTRGGVESSRSGYETDELAQIHRLLDRRVDGVILWPPFASLFGEHVEEFTSRDMPIVTIDHVMPASFRADSVGSNEQQGGTLAAEHLLELGHRRLAQIAGPGLTAWGAARRKSFDETIKKCAQATCLTDESPPGQPQHAAEKIRALLKSPSRPTALFAATDTLAKVAYRIAGELGLSVPGDLSIIGYADHDFAAEMNPPLTTVRQPAYEIGCRAAEIVIMKASGQSGMKRTLHDELDVSLVVRGSTTSPKDTRP